MSALLIILALFNILSAFLYSSVVKHPCYLLTDYCFFLFRNVDCFDFCLNDV